MSATRAPDGSEAGYLPIAEHGIIGDLHSAALIRSGGTIDWFCPPRFDGPSVFGALLDRRRGGFYRIAPLDPLAMTKQFYLPQTNVLVTRVMSQQGVSEIQDLMPIGSGPQRLIRSVAGPGVHSPRADQRGHPARSGPPGGKVSIAVSGPLRRQVLDPITACAIGWVRHSSGLRQ